MYKIDNTMPLLFIEFTQSEFNLLSLTASAMRSSMRFSLVRNSSLPAALRLVEVGAPPVYTPARSLRFAANSFSFAVSLLPSTLTFGSLNTFGGARL